MNTFQNTQTFAWSQSHSFTLNECHLFISPVISDPKTTVLQVISSTKVAKSSLSFHNLTSGRTMEVNQLRKKTIFLILGRIKQKTKQMLLRGGEGATQSTPPLDPPLLRVIGITGLWACVVFARIVRFLMFYSISGTKVQVEEIDYETLSLFSSGTEKAWRRDLLNFRSFVGEAENTIRDILSDWAHSGLFQWSSKGHFRVPLCLFFQASLSAKFLLW